MYSDSSPIGSHLHQELFGVLGEPEEDEGDTEEPEVSTTEQAGFDWACT